MEKKIQISISKLENCILFAGEILRNIPISNIQSDNNLDFWKVSKTIIKFDPILKRAKPRKWYKSTIGAPLVVIDVPRNEAILNRSVDPRIVHISSERVSSSARNTDFGRGIYKANTVTGGREREEGVGSTADPLCRVAAKSLRVWW